MQATNSCYNIGTDHNSQWPGVKQISLTEHLGLWQAPDPSNKLCQIFLTKGCFEFFISTGLWIQCLGEMWWLALAHSQQCVVADRGFHSHRRVKNSIESNRDAQQWWWCATGIQGGSSSRGGLEEEGRRGCSPRAEIPLRQHLSWSTDTPVAQGTPCARTGRRGRKGG